MSEFKEFITNTNFIGSYNVFLSGNIDDKNKGFVFVEDDSDSSFWEEFISHFYPDEYTFRTSSKSGEKITGKRFLESVYDKASSQFIIAVDSDYDYIASKTQPDHAFNNSKYIIHTYGFSRESVQLEKKSLQNFFRRCKWTISHSIDLIGFLDSFSKISFEGLTKYFVLLQSNGYSTEFQKEFDNCFNVKDRKLVGENLHLDSSIIDTIRNNLDNFFNSKDVSREETETAKSFLESIGINNDNAYRFISGHVFFDLMKKIHSDTLIQLQKKEIEQIDQDLTGVERGNRVKQIRNNFKDTFSFNAHCNVYPINLEDEVHRLILSDIENIKN